MSVTPAKAPARSRDRAATEALLINAAKAVLAEEGFAQFGLRAIARRAGCDKQLIYRYFGGLEGLVQAIGEELANWIAERLAMIGHERPATSYADLFGQLAVGYLRALRSDPLVQKIIAWEMTEDSPHVRQMSEARARALALWVAERRGSLSPPPGVDVFAANAVTIAAIQHLVLAAATSGSFAGLPLQSDADWERIEAAISRMVGRLFGD